MAVLLFFIDGFGIGTRKHNPLYQRGLWRHLTGLKPLISLKPIRGRNFCMVPVDPALGVPGIPQSATGQTALLTGINAPKKIGGHITGFPGPELSEIIKEHSLLKRLALKGFRVTSANAYSKEYFERVRAKNRRVSATTLAISAAAIPFRMEEELLSGKAVFADMTRQWVYSRYPGLKALSPGRAALHLKSILEEQDFVLYEYFLTDFYGHRGSLKEKKRIIGHLNGFLKKLCQTLDLKKHTLVICSDHGNIEDSTHEAHTANPVPVLIFSKKPGILNWFFSQTLHLTDIAGLIEKGLEHEILK